MTNAAINSNLESPSILKVGFGHLVFSLLLVATLIFSLPFIHSLVFNLPLVYLLDQLGRVTRRHIGHSEKRTNSQEVNSSPLGRDAEAAVGYASETLARCYMVHQ